MKALYLILLLAALIALNWRFLGLDQVFGRIFGGVFGPAPFGQRRPCRWAADQAMQGGRYGRYVCAACGAEAFTSNGRPPRDCRQG